MNTETINYDVFKNIFLNLLNDLAPLKEKLARGNNAPFMNKVLCKSFMIRSKLKNNYNKVPTTKNLKNYKWQRNFCVNLLRSEKINYFNNLDTKVFTDNKRF